MISRRLVLIQVPHHFLAPVNVAHDDARGQVIPGLGDNNRRPLCGCTIGVSAVPLAIEVYGPVS
jgi:hypothetical protein